MTKACPSGLYPYETERKARMAARKRTFETGGRVRNTVAPEPCDWCGFWHFNRALENK